jgi:tetratricopeptide (TPR) repeat protein
MAGCSALGGLGPWNRDDRVPAAAVDTERTNGFLSGLEEPARSAEVPYTLGTYYQAMGRHREAIEEFRKALTAEPYSAKALNGMATSYDAIGDYPRAVACYERAIEINPDIDYLYNNLGYSFLLQNKPDEAIEALKKGLAINPEKKMVHNLCLAYVLAKRLDMKFNISYSYMKLCETRKDVVEKNEIAMNGNTPEPASAGAELAQAKGPAAEDPGMPARQKHVAVNIEVSNGNGVNHMAKMVGDYLKAKGFNIVRVTNCGHFYYKDTKIYYRKEYSEDARDISMELPVRNCPLKEGGTNRRDVHIKVLVGKDFIKYKDKLMKGFSL